MLYVLRQCSAYLGWNLSLSDFLLPLYHLKPVCPVSDISEAFSVKQLLLTGELGYFST